jgi:glycosyltransferase involved in cell wall biosynthesis
MPSIFEPFGIVFIEAMMHGLPCVGADAWAMPEIIEDGETGWLVPAGDAAALAQTLIGALRNRQRLREMGLRGRRRAAARFDWRRAASVMLCRMYGLP